MKNLFTVFFIGFIFFSCSSNKIIEDFLVEDFKTNKTGKNNLMKIKVSPTLALKILKGMSYKKDSVNVYFGGSKILSSSEYEYLKDKIKKDTLVELWKDSEFKKTKLKIVYEKDNDVYNFFRRIPINEQRQLMLNLYFISKPIYFKNKDYVFFYIGKTNAFGNSLYNETVLLKKEKNKWMVVERVKPIEME